MDDKNLEETLATKKLALDALMNQRRFGPENKVLWEEMLELERSLAQKRGEAHAIEWSLGQAWNGMAYFPTVVGNALSCAIVFTTKTREYAVLGFKSIAAYRLTDVSDETIEGHPLNGKGLIAYRTFLVKNSPWINELKAIDQTHPQHDPARWQTLQHYLLSFKDRMFEAIAQEAELVGEFATHEKAIEIALEQMSPKRS